MGENEDGLHHLQSAGAAMEALDSEAAVEHLSAAIRAFTAAGDNRQAALACARLGDLFANVGGNLTAARAWFVRARRLVENEPPCVEQGWVAVAAMGCDVDDPDVLLANAELAVDLARRFGDVNLEAKGLADAGLAHVQAGRLAEGMAMLDEAMALVSGPADDDETAGRSICSFFTACYFACDFDRAGAWVDVLRRRGLLGDAPGAPVFVANHCDAVQATLLCELGRWSEAERVIERAMNEFERVMHIPSWHPVIALAELRIRQRRLAEAEQLLLGKEGHLQALLPAARLHAARGDFHLARATAERGLRAIGNDRLRAAELLALLVDIALVTGDTDEAARRCSELADRSKGLDVPALAARIAMTKARAQAAFGDAVAAIDTIEGALDAVPVDGLPVLRASLLIELARLHDRLGNSAAARVEAARAAAILAGLDVVIAPEDVALLDRLSGKVAGIATATPATDAVLRRDGSGWLLTVRATRARLPSSKGMRYLAELLSAPGVERHALDLVDRVEGVGDVDRRTLGDAGAAGDARARDAYRRRAEELRTQIDDAFATGADARALELQAELDEVVAALGRAFGIDGRARREGSATEKARLNVTRALRTAVKAVSAVAPDAGAVLDRSLRTGTYCTYEPKADEPVRWIVQSGVNTAAVE